MASLLTWLVPGAGHLYLGLSGFALLAFVVVQGLYLAGLKLSGGMLFEYLEPDLRGPFAGLLTPEAGNLGMLVYHMRAYGFGASTIPGVASLPRVWPSTMPIGVTLTALSGLLNALLIVRVHFDASRPKDAVPPKVSPARLVFLAWLVPGLGHFAQKRVLRGAIVFAALVGLFALGTFLSAGSNLDRERHFYYWAGQFLLGAPAMVAEFLHGHAGVTEDIPYVDGGLGMACVAGLLNVLAMIDVYNFTEAPSQAATSATPSDPTHRETPQAGTLA